MDETVFLVSALVILVGSVGVVASRNPVHSALFLVPDQRGQCGRFAIVAVRVVAAR